MANKFEKAKVTSGIKEVAKASNEQANLISIKYYKDEDLLDYPRNNEDVSHTEDIEKSIKEQGFTDPIEITDFGMEEGKYTIVSGHRRRVAGRKQGMKTFPCILRHFQSETEVYNYVLYSNSQRDSAKDPLLLVKRYKMHEEYLKESGFKGSVREEIASRLGISSAQADRYNQMNKVILPVWDMIRDGAVGMSSITDSGLYTHTPEEQTEIYNIMRECLESGRELTRPLIKHIVKSYRDGKKTWLDVIQIETESVVSDSSSSAEGKPLSRNDEVNYDYSHREGLPSGVDPLKDERLTEEDKENIDLAIKQDKDKQEKNEKPRLTEEEKKLVNGEKISNLLEKLENVLNDFYAFKDDSTALTVMNTMSSISKIMFAEMERIADSYHIEDKKFFGQIDSLIAELKSYKQ